MEDYICGTDPEDSQSVFRALISISNGRPMVSWEPILPAEEADARRYVILGADSLEGPWRQVDRATTTCRFFKVQVEAW